jgi:cell division protein FtsI (penicillin-binding protein 3)
MPIDGSDRRRLLPLAIGVCLLFGGLAIQFFRLQVIQEEKWEREAAMQHQVVLPEAARRGTFYSNNTLRLAHPEEPQPLAIDVQKAHLHADCVAIPAELRPELVAKLGELLGLGADAQKMWLQQLAKKSRSRRLAMWLDQAAQERVRSWWHSTARRNKLPTNALFFVNDYQRCYPYGKMLGQVLHTIRSLKDDKGQAVPTGGLELSLNGYLSGTPGQRRIIRSLHAPLDITTIKPPVHGADVYLTVNHYVQAILEEELEKGVQRAHAKGGRAVLMDCHTGEIWGLAEYPFFDVTRYAEQFVDPVKAQAAQVRSITDAIEMGSIMKPITLAIALEANEEMRRMGKAPLFEPEKMVATHAQSFAGRKKLMRDTHDHPWLNMDLAVQKSSNVYLSQVARALVDRMGANWWRSRLVEGFGLTKPTRIGLQGESVGLVPEPGKLHSNGALQWSGPTPYALALGHSCQVTSLQVVRAYAILANGGYWVDPTLVRQIVRHNEEGPGEVLVDHTEHKERRRVMSQTACDRIRRSIKYSTKPGGTASQGDIPGYSEGGKTGTAEKVIGGQYDQKIHLSTFVGIAPANDPRFVLLVTIDEPEYKVVAGVGKLHHAGWCAAPVFREMAKRVLAYLGTPPDDPHGYPVGDPRRDGDADWAAEVRSLKALYEQYNHKKTS